MAASPSSSRVVKVPTILQMEAVECGAASLAMIFAYFKHYIPLEKLREECNVTRDGTNALSLVKTARKHGLKASGHRGTLSGLDKVAKPAILWWNFNHFVVFEGRIGGEYYLNDPAAGRRILTEEEFSNSFTGVYLTFEPTDAFEVTSGPPGAMASLGPRLAKVRSALTFAAITGVALAIPGILIPGFTKVLVDRVLVEGRIDWLLPVSWLLLLALLVKFTAGWLQERYLAKLQGKLAVTMSASFFWHVIRLPLGFYHQRSAGDISTRLRSNDTVADLLSGRLANNLLATLNMVFFLAVMISYDPTLALAAVLAVGLNVLLLLKTNSVQVSESKKSQQEIGKQFGTLAGGILNIDGLKAAGREGDFFTKWAGSNAKAVDAQQRLGVIGNAMSVAPKFMKNIIVHALTLGYGGYQVMRGELTVGELTAFQVLVTSFVTPANQLVGLGTQIQTVQADLSRLDDVLLCEPDQAIVASESMPERGQDRQLSGHIEFRNVSFGYDIHAEPLVRDFSLEVKPGTRVALVGKTGSGKSTLAKIISGTYKPWGGQVLLDGLDMYEYSREERASSIGFVSQESHVFDGTVSENIRMWDDSISSDAVTRACKDAEIHAIVSQRPGGYEGVVEEGGGNMSGGQLQRIEIASALARNPSLLVMDEATSALDTETERLIDANIRRRGCTCIIIAHRLSTIRDADEILYLDKGVVVERGTHEALVANGGPYAELVRA